MCEKTWEKKKTYAIQELKSRSITRLKRLVLYYWLGKRIHLGKLTERLSSMTCKIAQRIYHIFLPLSRKQLAYTQHLVSKPLGKTNSRVIQQAVEVAKERVNNLRDSSIDNVKVESGEVLTSAHDSQFTVPLAMTLEEAHDLSVDLEVEDLTLDHTWNHTSDLVPTQVPTLVPTLTSALTSGHVSDQTSALTSAQVLDLSETSVPPLRLLV